MLTPRSWVRAVFLPSFIAISVAAAPARGQEPPPGPAEEPPQAQAPLPPQASAPPLAAPQENGGESAAQVGRTPVRLSMINGQVSFWRPGAQDWTPAQLNFPLAPGDALYAAPDAMLELQIGPHAFARASGDTQLSLDNLEPDYLQLRVTAGHLSLDVRRLNPGQTIEVDTPVAAFTIGTSGYYRVDHDTTTFITRRGGRASMTVAGGEPQGVASSEEVVITGSDNPTVESYVAPELDAWDRWNYERTDHLIDAATQVGR